MCIVVYVLCGYTALLGSIKSILQLLITKLIYVFENSMTPLYYYYNFIYQGVSKIGSFLFFCGGYCFFLQNLLFMHTSEDYDSTISYVFTHPPLLPAGFGWKEEMDSYLSK